MVYSKFEELVHSFAVMSSGSSQHRHLYKYPESDGFRALVTGSGPTA